VDFVGKPLALVEGHALDAEHGIDKALTGNRCHGAIVRRRWPAFR
jgi:hypothetical protein